MRHLLNVARALLHHHHVPKNFQGEAILTTTYVINKVPSKVLNNQSPFYFLSSFFPDLSLHTPLPLQVFGCVFFVHIPKIHRDKLDPRTLRCVFLGYSPTQKGYKCYNPSSQKFYASKDVTFVESQSFFGPPQVGPQGKTRECGDQSSRDAIPNLGSAPTSSNELVDTNQSPRPTSTPISPTSSTISSPQPTLSPKRANCNEQAAQQLPSPVRFKGSPYVFKRRQPIADPQPASTSDLSQGMEFTQLLVSTPSSPIPNDLGLPIAVKKWVRSYTQHPLSNYLSYYRPSQNHKSFLTSLDTIVILKSVDEALKDQNWKQAMLEEMKALNKNQK